MIDPEQILTSAGFEQEFRELLEGEISVFAQRAHYLFDISHPCDRYKVWRSTMWEAQRRHDPVLEAIFKEGHLHQPHVYQRLEQMGFSVVREQDRSKQWKVGSGAVISGRVDGRITAYRGTKYSPTLLLEIKSCSSHTFDTLQTMDDVRKAREHYVRTYYDQCQVGMLLENVERALLVLKNKATGWIKTLGVFPLDYAHAERVIQRIERLQGMITAQVDPPPIPYEPSICDRCGFNYLCWPVRDEKDGAVVLEDSQLAEDIDLWMELRPKHAEYEKVDKGLKAKVKTLVPAKGTGLVGEYVIQLTEKEVKAETAPRPARTDTIVSIKKLAT
jgi:CRISPR/Cas system-associated exonuclease Cas4 (RecB family)